MCYWWKFEFKLHIYYLLYELYVWLFLRTLTRMCLFVWMCVFHRNMDDEEGHKMTRTDAFISLDAETDVSARRRNPPLVRSVHRVKRTHSHTTGFTPDVSPDSDPKHSIRLFSCKSRVTPNPSVNAGNLRPLRCVWFRQILLELLMHWGNRCVIQTDIIRVINALGKITLLWNQKLLVHFIIIKIWTLN